MLETVDIRDRIFESVSCLKNAFLDAFDLEISWKWKY